MKQLNEPFKAGTGSLSFQRASVLEVKADAVVNAANTALLGGGGVDGAIHAAAGPELLNACRKLNGCPTGQVKVTPAFGIRTASVIIHAVGPVYRPNSETVIRQLSDCYAHALEAAAKNGCRSVAFPSISTGVYGFPVEAACLLAYRTVKNWLTTHPESPIRVIFCCFREAEFAAFERAAQTVQAE